MTYSVPSAFEHELRAGQLVAIPYGDRLVEGIVWRISDEVEEIDIGHDSEQLLTGRPHKVPLAGIRPLSTILDPEPALLPHQRQLAEWMAMYYVTPLAYV